LIHRPGYKQEAYATDSLKALQTGQFVLPTKRILGSTGIKRAETPKDPGIRTKVVLFLAFCLLGTWVNRGKKEGEGYAGPPPTAKIGSAGCGALPMSNLRSA
jgi:hypothetical protein